MALFNLDLDRDFALDNVTINETSRTINDTSNTKVISFFIKKDDTFLINDENKGGANAPALVASAVFNHLNGFLFPSNTALPKANDTSTTANGARVSIIGRPILEDRIKPGSLTSTVFFPNLSLSSYNDLQVSGNLTSIVPYGEIRGPLTSAASSNVVGTVFYDYGIVMFHGDDGTDYTAEVPNSASGFHLGSGSGANKAFVQYDFKTEKFARRGQFFCHTFNKDGNFSTNPTYADASGNVEANLTANPTTFITSVGLFNDSGELLAIAKVSPPVKKDFNSEAVFKVNLEY